MWVESLGRKLVAHPGNRRGTRRLVSPPKDCPYSSASNSRSAQSEQNDAKVVPKLHQPDPLKRRTACEACPAPSLCGRRGRSRWGSQPARVSLWEMTDQAAARAVAVSLSLRRTRARCTPGRTSPPRRRPDRRASQPLSADSPTRTRRRRAALRRGPCSEPSCFMKVPTAAAAASSHVRQGRKDREPGAPVSTESP
jgi:hypothetical protein